MKHYQVMPEGCRHLEVQAATAEMAYRGMCSWYNPNKRVVVTDASTGEVAVFYRKLDSAGNLLEIVRE